MADNAVLNLGSGGITAATDDIGGVHWQRVKAGWGADGSANDTSASTPLPITVISSAGIGNEDVAVVGADPGMLVHAQRADTPATDTSTDGDRAPFKGDAAGRIWVNASGAAVPVTDNSGSLTVDNGGTFPVQAAQSGTWNVGTVTTVTAVTAITNALPAGANAIGKLAANSGVDIGDVDVTSLPNVTLAAGTNTNEVVGDVAHDAVAAGNPVLTGAYASAAAPSDVSADADAVRVWALRNGSQVVNIAAGGALIGATSNAIDVNIKSGAGSGGTAMADDAAFTVAVTSFTPCGGIVTADSVDSGDGGAFAMLANRQQKVTLYDSGGVELAVGGGTQYTEDAAAAANPVGNALIVVREDARAGSLTSTDGDNIALRGNNLGELYVKHTDALTVNSHAVTNAGTFAAQVTSVPADPFGVNADAASATGSISAKLRFIAGTGIPITGTVTVGSHAVTNAGTFVVQENGTQVVADDAAFTPTTTKVVMAGYEADETATVSVGEGHGGAARMTLDRKQISTLYAHAAAGGATPYQNLDVDESEDDVKTAAGKVFWVHAMNLSTTKKYLKFYNATAANVTVGSTTPVLTLPIPTMGDTNGAGFTLAFGAVGVQFDTAICIASTTGFAVADTGAPGTNEVIVNLGYL